MWKSDLYDKGTRKAQYTGSYGDFNPVHVKSEGERYPTDTVYCKTAESEEAVEFGILRKSPGIRSLFN